MELDFTNYSTKQEIKKYIREGSILIVGLIILEFIIVFPQELTQLGFDMDTLTYTGQVSLIRALGIGFMRALVFSIIGAFKKVVRKN